MAYLKKTVNHFWLALSQTHMGFDSQPGVIKYLGCLLDSWKKKTTIWSFDFPTKPQPDDFCTVQRITPRTSVKAKARNYRKIDVEKEEIIALMGFKNQLIFYGSPQANSSIWSSWVQFALAPASFAIQRSKLKGCRIKREFWVHNIVSCAAHESAIQQFDMCSCLFLSDLCYLFNSAVGHKDAALKQQSLPYQHCWDLTSEL